VDEVLTPAIQEIRIREGHPELSFAAMAGAPLKFPKRRPPGKIERLKLVERGFPDAARAIAVFGHPGARVDVLDAYAMLWTAQRIRSGQAEVIPSVPPRDSRGLRMEMVV
jgi:predicted RNase H-like nuclease